MLVLCIIYIVGFYILKFIFPNTLLLVVTDPTILKFGQFVESWTGYLHIYYFLTTFVTFYLFVSASRGSFKLRWLDLLYIMIAVVINRLVTELCPQFMVHTSTSLMFLLAWLCKGKLSYSVITFVTHGFLSQFLFSIRGFETIIMSMNVASSMLLGIEGYVWLALFGILFYLKEKKNGKCITTIPKQNG